MFWTFYFFLSADGWLCFTLPYIFSICCRQPPHNQPPLLHKPFFLIFGWSWRKSSSVIDISTTELSPAWEIQNTYQCRQAAWQLPWYCCLCSGTPQPQTPGNGQCCCHQRRAVARWTSCTTQWTSHASSCVRVQMNITAWRTWMWTSQIKTKRHTWNIIEILIISKNKSTWEWNMEIHLHSQTFYNIRLVTRG